MISTLSKTIVKFCITKNLSRIFWEEYPFFLYLSPTPTEKNDQINENKMRTTLQPNVHKWNVYIIRMIINNIFYEHIWKQTHLIPLQT